jgi:hypothetical protein
MLVRVPSLGTNSLIQKDLNQILRLADQPCQVVAGRRLWGDRNKRAAETADNGRGAGRPTPDGSHSILKHR